MTGTDADVQAMSALENENARDHSLALKMRGKEWHKVLLPSEVVR